jgi:hypothetical protein
MIEGILVLFIYITRLASYEIFSPSNKMLLIIIILIPILLYTIPAVTRLQSEKSGAYAECYS